MADGQVCGFPAQIGLAGINGKTSVFGTLSTEGRNPEDLFQGSELDLQELTGHLTVLPGNGTEFSASFIQTPGEVAFSLIFPEMYCGIHLSTGAKQLFLQLHTDMLLHGNSFEQSVAQIAEWFRIRQLTLLVRNHAASYSLLQKLSSGFSSLPIPSDYENDQLIACGAFDLSQTEFGQSIAALIQQKQLPFAVGGCFKDKSFGARLISEEIQTDTFIIRNLMLSIEKSVGSFYCLAGGTFIIRQTEGNIGFTLSGSVSPKSFMLSGASLPDVRIPVNSRLSFSDLALTIGISAGRPTFGMTARLNTNNLSIFGSFVLNPPLITLFTAALTSTTGRISLKDLLVEIADIDGDPIQWLDVVAVGDFDLPDTRLRAESIRDFPTDRNAEDYQEVKKEIEEKVKADFNTQLSSWAIAGEAQLIPLGNDTGQYILTDKNTMRHFRIDHNGKISLNCQVYICTQETVLGGNKMPLGFFICGTLEIFGIRSRYLFLVEKGKSLMALVQIGRISLLNGLFVLESSSNPMPAVPIDEQASKLLVKNTDSSHKEGATLYLNIQKDKGEVTFYISASISLLKIFHFDTLILVKNKLVYINIETQYLGFRFTLNLQGSYENFSQAGFSASLIFDTAGFREILEKAQKSLKEAAQAVEKEVKEATRKLEEAQQSVLNLQRKIDGYNNRINECRRIISQAKWYQIGKKIAHGLEIAALEVAKAGVYVAIGVAYAALEVAQAALKLGGAVVSTVLKSLTYVISAATQILWIKSFEIDMAISPEEQEIHAHLILTIFGKDVSLGGRLNLSNMMESIKEFVSDNIGKQSEKLIEDIRSGKVTRALDALSEDRIDHAFVKEYGDLNRNKEKYEELQLLRDAAEDLFVSSNEAYYEAYQEEHPDAREFACHLTGLRWEEETFHEQHQNAFDDEFVDSLENLVQVVREKKATTLSGTSHKKETDMDTLLRIVRDTRDKRSRNHYRNGPRVSLFSRVDQNSGSRRSGRRLRSADHSVSAAEANEKYAETLTQLIDKHLGNLQGEAAESLRRDLGIAIYQFRHPDISF